MSTRSTITLYTGSGFETIYCHFDGYIYGVGRMLMDSYKTKKDVESLVSLGDLSSLEKFTECPDGHSYDNRMADYCVAYGRDRGEDNTEKSKSDSFENCQKEEFNYLFIDGIWTVDNDGSYDDKIHELGSLLKE